MMQSAPSGGGKTLFLTSSPFLGCEFNPLNRFTERLKESLSHGAKRGLYIAADPKCRESVLFSQDVREVLEKLEITFEQWDTLTGANAAEAAELVRGAGLIVLGGGHVPTQNRFFHRIGLKELLTDWQGVVLGISAGSMNCAETVYAQPEESGESKDPNYERFLPGLGLTECQLLPHYQKTHRYMLDGRRLYEDITYADSIGHEFYAIPDGSYLFADADGVRICGESWRIAGGRQNRLTQVRQEHWFRVGY